MGFIGKFSLINAYHLLDIDSFPCFVIAIYVTSVFCPFGKNYVVQTKTVSWRKGMSKKGHEEKKVGKRRKPTWNTKEKK